MKEKAIIFIVGLLLGAIISTGSIYFYTISNTNNNSNNMDQRMKFNEGNPPSNPDGNFQNRRQSAN